MKMFFRDFPCVTAVPADVVAMKYPLGIVSSIVITLLPATAEPGPQVHGPASAAPEAAAEARYLSESPLPKGWPEPGPFNQVVRKKYPAYRAAFTPDASPNFGFWRLFNHIKKHEIPMSAPVEMKLDGDTTKSLKMEEMAFLYQSREVGATGGDGARVEVRDVPAQEALSYAWLGPRDDAVLAAARTAIDAELAKQNLKAASYRLLGYNSPFIPKPKQTHELQAVIR